MTKTLFDHVMNPEVAYNKSHGIRFCHGEKFNKKKSCKKSALNKHKTELCVEGFTGAMAKSSDSALAHGLADTQDQTNATYTQFSNAIVANCNTYQDFLKAISKIPNFYDFLGYYKSQTGQTKFHMQGFYIGGICKDSQKRYFYVQPTPLFMAREIKKPTDIKFTNNDITNLQNLLPNISNDSSPSNLLNQTAQQFLCPPITSSTGSGATSFLPFSLVCIPSPNPTNIVTLTQSTSNNKNIILNIPLGPPLLPKQHQPCQSIGRNFIVNTAFNDSDIQDLSKFSAYKNTNAKNINNYCISPEISCGSEKCWDVVNNAGDNCNEVKYLPQFNVNNILVGNDGQSNCYYSTKPAKDLFSKSAIKYGLPSTFNFTFNGLFLKQLLRTSNDELYNKYGQVTFGFTSLTACQNFIKKNKSKIETMTIPPHEIIILSLENVVLSNNTFSNCNNKCIPMIGENICKYTSPNTSAQPSATQPSAASTSIQGQNVPHICVNQNNQPLTSNIKRNIGFSMGADSTYNVNLYDRSSSLYVPVCRIESLAFDVSKQDAILFSPSRNATQQNTNVNVSTYEDIYIGYTDNLDFINITTQKPSQNSLNKNIALTQQCGNNDVSLPSNTLNTWKLLKMPADIKNNMTKYPIDSVFNVGMDFNKNGDSSKVVATTLSSDYLKGFKLVKLSDSALKQELSQSKSSTSTMIKRIDSSTQPIGLGNPGARENSSKIIKNMTGSQNAVLYVKGGNYQNKCYGYHFTGNSNMLNSNNLSQNQTVSSTKMNMYEIWLKTPEINSSKINSACSTYVQPISAFEAAGAFGSPSSGPPNTSCLNKQMNTLLDYSLESTWKNSKKENFTSRDNPLANSVTNSNSIMNRLNTDIEKENKIFNHLQHDLATSVKNTNDAIGKSIKWNIKNNSALNNLDIAKAQEEDRYLHRTSNNYHFFAWGAAAIVLVAASIKISH